MTTEKDIIESLKEKWLLKLAATYALANKPEEVEQVRELIVSIFEEVSIIVASLKYERPTEEEKSNMMEMMQDALSNTPWDWRPIYRKLDKMILTRDSEDETKTSEQ